MDTTPDESLSTAIKRTAETDALGIVPRPDNKNRDLDPKTQAEAANRAKTKPVPGKHRKRLSSPIPRELLRAIVQMARKLKKDHGPQFAANPELKNHAARLFRSILPPRPKRRGRPPIDTVTTAIRLLRTFKRSHPNEKPEQIWARIYPLAIPSYESFSKDEKRAQRLLLRDRVRSRRNQNRRRRTSPRGHTVSAIESIRK
jgi:hypothetical protein